MYFYELHVRGPHNNITHNITFKLKYQPENRREDDALFLICQDVNVKFWDFCPADVFILKSAARQRDETLAAGRWIRANIFISFDNQPK